LNSIYRKRKPLHTEPTEIETNKGSAGEDASGQFGKKLIKVTIIEMETKMVEFALNNKVDPLSYIRKAEMISKIRVTVMNV